MDEVFQCVTFKFRYTSVRTAMGRAETAKHKTGHWIIPYKCPHCHGWHVGHASREFIQVRLDKLRNQLEKLHPKSEQRAFIEAKITKYQDRLDKLKDK